MGKPLQPPKNNNSSDRHELQNSTQTPEQQMGIHDDRGLKIIPDIDFKNLRSQRQGSDKLIVKAWVVNNSGQDIRVDNSYLLKQKRTHNQQLRPRESRELTLFDGFIPAHENETSAQVEYRLQVNGDVFMEKYRVDYYRESDGKYVISDLIDDGPVRDI